MNEQNGHDHTEPVLEDRVELELRERVTVLEEIARRANTQIGVLALGVLAAAVALVSLQILVRRRLS